MSPGHINDATLRAPIHWVTCDVLCCFPVPVRLCRAPAALIVPSERLADLLTALPIALSVSQEVATDILLQVTALTAGEAACIPFHEA